MIRWLIDRWRKLQRDIDLEILWPICKREALALGDVEISDVAPLDKAKAAFAWHAFHDPAWLALGPEEIYRQIDELT